MSLVDQDIVPDDSQSTPTQQQQTQTTEDPNQAYLFVLQKLAQIGEQSNLYIRDQRVINEQVAETHEALLRRIKGASSSGSSNARFREPFTFRGKATEVNDFLMVIKDAIQLSRKGLPLEEDKCLFMASYFGEGGPRQWYTAMKTSQPILLQNFEAFCAEFKWHFGSSNVQAEAMRKIDQLWQSGSAAAYAARYIELLVHVDWSEATKIDKFYEHLKPAVKDMVVVTKRDDRPKTFKDYTDFVIEIDNRLHDRELERKLEDKHRNGKSKPRSEPASTTSYPGTAQQTSSDHSLPPGEPMEVDSVKTKPRGPLTAQEKERRKKNNLCLYCGGPDHKIDSCPNMSEGAKKRHATIKAEASKASPATGKA